MIHLFSDPKPHLPDSPLWTSILRDQLPVSNINGKAHLASMLHTLREQGTMIQHGKLVPLVHPGKGWDSEAEFKEMTVFLKPFAWEIKNLIERANDHDHLK